MGRQAAFIGLGETLEQDPADDQAEDRVAQKLEALVVAIDQIRVLVGVGGVHEGLVDGPRIAKDEAESLTQLVDGG